MVVFSLFGISADDFIGTIIVSVVVASILIFIIGLFKK